MSPTGHIAMGFITRNYAPRIPLLVLIFAAYVIDILNIVFMAIGIESIEYAPWSHSLLMAIIWSGLTLLLTLILTRNFKSGLALGLVVFSHWVLDFFVWNNMLITFDKNMRIGLGIYNKIGFSQTNFMKIDASTMIASFIELCMLVFGIIRYRNYRKKRRKGEPVLG